MSIFKTQDKLSEKKILDMKPLTAPQELTREETFSLYPSLTDTRTLEKDAIATFNLKESSCVTGALNFVADELGVKYDDLRPQEVLLAIHYIAVYGGGYNKILDCLVLDTSSSVFDSCEK